MPAEPEQDPKPRGYVGHATLSGELAVIDPVVQETERPMAIGFGVEVVAGPPDIPVLGGLGAGFLTLASSGHEGPATTTGSVEVNRSLELRHAELLVRVQPRVWRLRPFVQGFVGVMALWDDASVEADSGLTDEEVDEQMSAGLLYGAAGGVSIDLWTTKQDGESVGLALTLGVRRWFTTDMDRWQAVGDAGGTVVLDDVQAPLRAWVPFAGLSLTLD